MSEILDQAQIWTHMAADPHWDKPWVHSQGKIPLKTRYLDFKDHTVSVTHYKRDNGFHWGLATASQPDPLHQKPQQTAGDFDCVELREAKGTMAAVRQDADGIHIVTGRVIL